jgi:hypothetical protein
MGNLYMRKQIAPYAMPVVYVSVALIGIVGMVLISARVLIHEGVERLWREK